MPHRRLVRIDRIRGSGTARAAAPRAWTEQSRGSGGLDGQGRSHPEYEGCSVPRNRWSTYSEAMRDTGKATRLALILLAANAGLVAALVLIALNR